ncbi:MULTISPECIES: hypothetical protein [unclassified Coleofasciculus]|uniref:hypothetical protein n=1 Tax=unclassified Coleofasciculus TaxID=2692782 RepID=UPI0018813FC0|nr:MULTISPECIES: hypothetical protein [unclassified Coleofasciculus]MBE9127684.1 hypothetical protein [Coleofasciculus sp. LEGE 07081]MBE9151022.1 hypothetical protein [Coleofasciculus sp. LEGE 07092]
MTSREQTPEVVILCEDIAHERFIRQYLICCEFEDRKIKDFGNPKGRKLNNNNDFVIKHYAPLVKSYRSKNFQNRAVVVMIDADNNSISNIIRSLNIALDEEEGKLNQELRLPNKKIAIFVPARNIETWFYYINIDQNCDETTDYKNHPEIRKMNSIDLAQASATKLAREICPKGLYSNALSSLHHACSELRRLLY